MKVFISQPMNGLNKQEIKLNRAKAIENIKRLYGNEKPFFLSQVSQLNFYQTLKLFLKKVIKYESKCTRWTFS